MELNKSQMERDIISFLIRQYGIPVVEKIIVGLWDRIADYFTGE